MAGGLQGWMGDPILNGTNRPRILGACAVEISLTQVTILLLAFLSWPDGIVERNTWYRDSSAHSIRLAPGYSIKRMATVL